MISCSESPIWGGGGRLQERGNNCSTWWRSICRICEELGEGVGRWFDDNIRRVVGDGRNTLFWYDTWLGKIPLRLKFPRLFDQAANKKCSVEEMWRLGWVWRCRLLAWEEECVRECSVLCHNVVLQDKVLDT